MGEFETPLILTTPHMRGRKVKDAQWLLAGHNRFAATEHPLSTYTGRIDGEYGPVVAGATSEAKKLLGYASDSINESFGQLVYDLLIGKQELPEDYLGRRNAILAELNTPVKLKALQLAIKQLGVKEVPINSNKTPYGEWYGMNGVFWCAIFASWVISHVHQPDWKYSYVPTIYYDAMHGRNGMSITHSPEPGDLVTYNWDGPNCHVEFFEQELSNGFSAIGGNTGPYNFSNGGEVARSTRHYNNVTAFIRLSL